MVYVVKKLAKLDVGLTIEERNLLSMGYKNVVSSGFFVLTFSFVYLSRRLN